MHGVVNVTAHVEDQVFADQTHKVGADHADVVVGGIFAEVGVDGGQALGHGAGALEGGLVAQHHFQTVFFAPAHGFESRAAGAHATTHDQQVEVMFLHFRFSNGNAFHRFLDGNHRHSGFSLSSTRLLLSSGPVPWR